MPGLTRARAFERLTGSRPVGLRVRRSRLLRTEHARRQQSVGARLEGSVQRRARVASSNGAAGEGPGRTNLMAVPSTDNLRRLAALLEDGTLQVHIHDTFEFDHATDALQALATEHVRGKLAISVR
jgi:NADPH:quinone reductase-like Zn-dependent oxidoreductase